MERHPPYLMMTSYGHKMHACMPCTSDLDPIPSTAGGN